MEKRQPFIPSYDPQTVVLAGTIQSADIILPKNTQTVRVSNTGGSSCYVKIGKPGITASNTDLFIQARTPIIPIFITKNSDDTVLRAVSAAGTTIIVESGESGY